MCSCQDAGYRNWAAWALPGTRVPTSPLTLNAPIPRHSCSGFAEDHLACTCCVNAVVPITVASPSETHSTARRRHKRSM
jgi:hypothetical protein